ncbi:transcriptional regulator, LacI family [Polaromonas sp. OV174]|uniref:LacI family DNA-binding transcriptional regulator n=1 Tax=Polaromonas sp. OV174 TaxID=1855300 RepID=UPI0008DECD33|nr:substrate-binding domain-containing protein [Polaromonas sp. OV174]SFC72243.1 transcriptional regulator, LacI family [Polaromonas sp. OV174]
MTLDRRSTLADVARLAGVSLGSASRALSVPNEVKPATLAKVQQAVAQLGYVRNGAAQALASRRTRTVAAIYPTLSNPIFSVSIHKLQQTLWKYGYQLLVASHEYEPQREIDLLRAIVERGVDAIVLVGTDHSHEVYELARQYGLPYVLTWSFDDSTYPHCVGFSYYDAAYEMAKVVVESGHTRIALCNGFEVSNERARARVAGTRAALKAAGISLRRDWVTEQPFNFEGGREAVRRFMGSEDCPTVLICGTDLQAIGAIDECRIRGIRVPEDLSITGFDDIEHAAIVVPPLTTVHVPTEKIGILAAQRIVELIEGREMPAFSPLETTVVIRKSLLSIQKTSSLGRSKRASLSASG